MQPPRRRSSAACSRFQTRGRRSRSSAAGSRSQTRGRRSRSSAACSRPQASTKQGARRAGKSADVAGGEITAAPSSWAAHAALFGARARALHGYAKWAPGRVRGASCAARASRLGLVLSCFMRQGLLATGVAEAALATECGHTIGVGASACASLSATSCTHAVRRSRRPSNSGVRRVHRPRSLRGARGVGPRGAHSLSVGRGRKAAAHAARSASSHSVRAPGARPCSAAPSLTPGAGC